MAENENGQEKTEEPTPKRLAKSKEDGQVARSRELSTTAILMAGAGGFLMFGPQLSEALMGLMRVNFDLSRDIIYAPEMMPIFLFQSLVSVFMGFMPLFALLVFAAAISPVMLGGWVMSAKNITPKLSRINPQEGLKRMFSDKSLIELVKSIFKVGLVAVLALTIMMAMRADMLAISKEPIVAAIVHSSTVLGWTCLALALATAIIAAIDVPYQIFDHNRKLKMTLQEIKDEMKDTEGKPEVKRRIRELQMEMANRRMMEAVPQADVVITNPTHFSIALKYDPDGSGAPMLVAKGVDQTALKIREIANAHEIIMVEAPPLARAIYYTTELEQEIPAGLYLSVAQVLAYVFQLRQYKPGTGPRPKAPNGVDVPDDFTYDTSGKKPEDLN